MAQSANQSHLIQIIKVTPEVSATELLLPSTAGYCDNQLSHFTVLPGVFHLENADSTSPVSKLTRFGIKREKNQTFCYFLMKMFSTSTFCVFFFSFSTFKTNTNIWIHYVESILTKGISFWSMVFYRSQKFQTLCNYNRQNSSIHQLVDFLQKLPIQLKMARGKSNLFTRWVCVADLRAIEGLLQRSWGCLYSSPTVKQH